MPRVAQDGGFSVYVYANEHNPPHCHLYWNAGEKEALIDLRTFEVIEGDAVSKRGARIISKRIQEIREVWNQLHPDNFVREDDAEEAT